MSDSRARRLFLMRAGVTLAILLLSGCAAGRPTNLVRLREGYEVSVETNSGPLIRPMRGSSKQMVGEAAARIRKVRPPEPYKGKGIRYRDEYVARKVGKRA